MTNAATEAVLTGQAGLWSNWIQLGFAGFSLILLLVLAWVIRSFVKFMHNVMAQNNAAAADGNISRAKLAENIGKQSETTRAMAAAVENMADAVRGCDFNGKPKPTGRPFAPIRIPPVAA